MTVFSRTDCPAPRQVEPKSAKTPSPGAPRSWRGTSVPVSVHRPARRAAHSFPRSVPQPPTMEGIGLIQDLAVVLLFAGAAGVLCKRVGLSVIVGYLAAGMLIGPYTPPFAFISDVDRVQTLSQVGLVFLMFAIGLGLSLTKLKEMGLPVLLATGLGAFFMLNLTQILGVAVGWTPLQSLFVASMFMVSSSAVIAKIIGELKLTHEGSAQRALSVTVMEDVVAVVMLTVLASQTQGSGDTNLGGLLATMSAFVVLLVGAGLLLVPRLFRRLEAKADPELQAIIVAGLLFLLAVSAAKAGYSLALGAFLLGAIVAEMPQKAGVERAFVGMRDIFSSVFFVSIGMMIDPRLLLDVWVWVLGLTVFVMIARPLATSLAMIVTGAPPQEARRASLLLTPLGEFSFIIAQLGVSSRVLPERYYPLAVGVAILTVLVTPFVNRRAPALLGLVQRIEPRWLTRTFDAYHGWLTQIREGNAAPLVWRLAKGRLIQVVVEMLLVTGLLIFAPPLLEAIEPLVRSTFLEGAMLPYVYWGFIGLLVLILIFAIWRNLVTVGMVFAESLGAVGVLTPGMIDKAFRGLIAVILGYWLYLILPVESLPAWGWVFIAAGAMILIGVSSSRLIYWHSAWQSSVQDVFAGEAAGGTGSRATARATLGHGLESWGLRLEEVVIPDLAASAGVSLAQLGLTARFSCSVVEIERNGYVITSTGPDLRIYPGDKLLLLGRNDGLVGAREYLLAGSTTPVATPEGAEGAFSGSILETGVLRSPAHDGKTLAELKVAQATGVRIVGVQRGEERIINPDGRQVLRAGDHLLVVGTLTELRAFRRWLKPEAAPPATGTGTPFKRSV